MSGEALLYLCLWVCLRPHASPSPYPAMFLFKGSQEFQIQRQRGINTGLEQGTQDTETAEHPLPFQAASSHPGHALCTALAARPSSEGPLGKRAESLLSLCPPLTPPNELARFSPQTKPFSGPRSASPRAALPHSRACPVSALHPLPEAFLVLQALPSSSCLCAHAHRPAS